MAKQHPGRNAGVFVCGLMVGEDRRRTEVPVNAGYLELKLEILNGQPYLRYVMTNFIDGMGRPIPAEAFENDPGAPGAPAMSPADLKIFREETAALADRIKKLR